MKKTSGITTQQMRDLLFEHVRSYGQQSCLADLMGISPQYLGDILRGRRGPSQSVAAALGYDRVTVYVKRP